jgi:hypothetical protein
MSQTTYPFLVFLFVLLLLLLLPVLLFLVINVVVLIITVVVATTTVIAKVKPAPPATCNLVGHVSYPDFDLSGLVLPVSPPILNPRDAEL